MSESLPFFSWTWVFIVSGAVLFFTLFYLFFRYARPDSVSVTRSEHCQNEFGSPSAIMANCFIGASLAFTGFLFRFVKAIASILLAIIVTIIGFVVLAIFTLLTVSTRPPDRYTHTIRPYTGML